MYVIKSNGKKQSFFPNKIFNRIKKAAEGLEIKSDELFTDCVQGLVDGMTTEELDKHIASTAANKMVLHNDYNIFASRILISRHSKKIGVEATDTDYMYDFIGFNSFLYKYSIKNDKKEPLELPHMMYKRVSDYLFEDENVLGVTNKIYDTELADRNISVATPQLMNFGTSRKSGISCNITSLIDDSKEGILDTLNAASISSSDGAGIGLHIHNLRSRKTLVSSFKGFAGGVTRFCDMVQSHMRFFKQGNRSGSAAVYLGVWHLDVEDFLHLRLQIGEERNRTRDLFTAVCIPDLFYEKLNFGDDDWYLFCPHQVKQAGFEPLYDVYGDKFKERYNELVKAGIGTKVSLKKIWNMILTSAAEAGLPYVWNWCNANKRNPQSNIGIRRGSNLCIEYYGVSRPNYTSQCNLGLIPLHNLDKNDFEEVARRVRILTIGLNKAIDKTVWSTKDAEAAGEDQRTIGIGIGGLADYMAKHKIVFDSDEALEFNKKLMEVMYTTAKETSSELAVKYYKKSYSAWKGSEYEKEGTPMSNSLLLCLMPSASTSALLGVNECFEPFHSNMFLRRLDVGEFVVVNKYLQKELQELGMWNSYIISLILKDEGSIQNIPTIPDDIKQRYKTIFEYKQKNLIDLAVVRQENIDQGQSMNLYFKEATTGKIGGALNYGWKKGLPTGSYYIKTESVLKAPTRLAVNSDLTEKPKDSLFECFNCSA
jgi:ribonucleotide reductase alpha subunit